MRKTEHHTIEGNRKTKNSIKRLFFCLLAIFLQIAFFLSIMNHLNTQMPWINALTKILVLILVLYIYSKNKTSSLKMPWIILILVMPVLGVCLYLMFQTNKGTRNMRKRYQEIDAILLPCLPPNHEISQQLKKHCAPAGSISDYLYRNAAYPVYQNTDVTYYPEAVQGLEAQLADLAKAEKFIFMEYHAIENADAWQKIQTVLAERVQAGVEVRVFYDDMGSISFLNHDFAKQLEALGIACRVFNPFVPGVNLFLNNRDHRKITVIDGKIGFTGGYNLANEYFGFSHPYGEWKDTGIAWKEMRSDLSPSHFLKCGMQSKKICQVTVPLNRICRMNRIRQYNTVTSSLMLTVRWMMNRWGKKSISAWQIKQNITAGLLPPI